jgi:importin subunit alpha-1
LDKVKEALPIASELTSHSDLSVRTDALWAISYLSDGNDKQLRTVVSSPGLPARLSSFLTSTEPTELTPALRAVGNLMSGDDRTTQCLLNEGVLPKLAILLSHQTSNVRRETCWTLSNVFAGPVHQLRQCLEAGLMDSIIQCCSDIPVVCEQANWCIVNAFVGSNIPEVAKLCTYRDIIPTLLQILSAPQPELKALVLRAIQRIMIIGDALSVSSEDSTNPFLSLVNETCGSQIRNLLVSGNSHATKLATGYMEGHFFYILPDQAL